MHPGKSLACSIVLSVFFGAAPARAADPIANDSARLAAFLKTGADAAKAKTWDACIEAYTAALQIEAAPVTGWGELGLCEEALGRYALADRHLRRALEAKHDDQKQPWKAYSAALVRIRQHVAWLFVGTDPPNARVIMDGHPLGVIDGGNFAVEPGTHTLVGRLAGYEDDIQTRTMRAGDLPTIQLQLKLKPVVVAPSVLPAPAPKPPPIVPMKRLERSLDRAWYVPELSVRGLPMLLAYATGAATIASAATLIGLEVDRGSKTKGLDRSACYPGNPTQPPLCAALHDRREQRDVAVGTTIGFGVTTALLAGVSGLVIARDRGPESPKLALTVQGGGIGITGIW